MRNVFKKIVGSKNERTLKRLRPLVRRIASLEESLAALSDDELRAKTAEFRRRLADATAGEREAVEKLRSQAYGGGDDADGESSGDLREALKDQEKKLYDAEGEVMEEILPEAFACVREASRRTIGLRHYDVQILGGVILHRGTIAEMKTGEGKTLVATLPLYLNTLSGRGAHLVTVNDYLARRDVQWMGPIFHILGVSVAAIVHEASFVFDPTAVARDYRMRNLRPVTRKEAYAADVTYGTNHEFGFDYLRDNMKFTLEEYVQRELTYAIVDEVDNILIDEARTPLIISGPAEESTDKYGVIDRIVPRLTRGATVVGDVREEERAAVDAQGDYTVDEKGKTVTLTERGVAKVERMLNISNLYDPGEMDTLHHVQQALKAHVLFKRDVDYVVKDGQVIIVDEFTGRLMPGRRWSDGLHQAVEAKEGQRVQSENQTLATITIQNYFRMYRKLAGMTGTADTEAPEFKKIYELDVVVIPSNKPLIRTDFPDVVYRTEREKFDAVVDQIAESHERGQPVLVGTVSVQKSELLSKMLKRRGVKHNVLNAVNHEAEANIIAQAGSLGGVTIATNMAGRGTDILLGGNPEFLGRADMEHEWVQQNASLPKGAQRYEDLLVQAREQEDAAVEKLRAAYEPELAPLQEAQAAALEALTVAHRSLMEAKFWSARGRYESCLEGLESGPDAEALNECATAAEGYGAALQELDHNTGPHFGEEGERRFSETLSELCAVLRDTARNGAKPDAHLSTARQAFERSRADYERAVHRVLSGEPEDGVDLDAERRAYEEAKKASTEAEALYAAQEEQYRRAVKQVRDEYEKERRSYTSAIEEVREQMEQAPAEFQGRYDEILRRYEAKCVGEREKVVEAGGLFIIGTERHESRRIDNQLRGRAGRQGDPGASRFYLSLEDDLLRIFGAERIQGLMGRLGMEEGEPIEHRLITRAIANAQSRVEGHNFDMRKHLLEYDDVMNKQREVIYAQRREVLARDTRHQVVEMVQGMIEELVDRYAPRDVSVEEWDWAALDDAVFVQFNMRLGLSEDERADMNPERLESLLRERVRGVYEEREQAFESSVMRQLERFVLLQTIDGLWKNHLLAMDHLKEGIGLRGYAQQNPLHEYQKEGFAMFQEVLGKIQEDAVQKLFTVQVAREEDMARIERQRQPQDERLVMSGGGLGPQVPRAKTVRRDGSKIGRNAPCPCGSGKKYKKCHGA